MFIILHSLEEAGQERAPCAPGTPLITLPGDWLTLPCRHWVPRGVSSAFAPVSPLPGPGWVLPQALPCSGSPPFLFWSLCSSPKEPLSRAVNSLHSGHIEWKPGHTTSVPQILQQPKCTQKHMIQPGEAGHTTDRFHGFRRGGGTVVLPRLHSLFSQRCELKIPEAMMR